MAGLVETLGTPCELMSRPGELAAGEEQKGLTFSEKLRRAVGIGLLGTLFTGGCAPAVDVGAHIAALPRATALDINAHRLPVIGKEIAVEGKLQLLRDASYTTTVMMPMPISNGKMTTIIMMPQTQHHSEYWYQLSEDSSRESLAVRSSATLDQGSSVIAAGTVCVADDGSRFLDVTYVMPSPPTPKVER